jgi:hypothetical protein
LADLESLLCRGKEAPPVTLSSAPHCSVNMYIDDLYSKGFNYTTTAPWIFWPQFLIFSRVQPNVVSWMQKKPEA